VCVYSELTYFAEYLLLFLSVAQPLIKNRNFDPESRTLKKLTHDDVEMEDTVETQVKGLAEQIIADDENRRAQELVRNTKFTVRRKLMKRKKRMFSILLPSDRTGI
jgi:hypothetical protein